MQLQMETIQSGERCIYVNVDATTSRIRAYGRAHGDVIVVAACQQNRKPMQTLVPLQQLQNWLVPPWNFKTIGIQHFAGIE